eukprot:GGOE01060849.1.p1 GENE.GGOE01060849.1~~GGOE01060849.1.p1  ORF type:complete len:290 (+),score=63.92 GGOE01060849.1:898-1767(+)
MVGAVRRVADIIGSSSSRATDPPATRSPQHEVVSDEDPDEALARRLQAEEEELAARAHAHSPAEERPPIPRTFQEQLLPRGPSRDPFLFTTPFDAGPASRSGETDEEMARRLQWEEEETARFMARHLGDEGQHDDFVSQRQPPRSAPHIGLRHLLGNMRGAPLPAEQFDPNPNMMLFWPFLDPQMLNIIGRRDDTDDATYEQLLRLEEQLGIVSRGASVEQIDALPTTVAQSRHSAAAEAPHTCAVCLEEFDTGQSLRTLPCLHQFHRECVDRWLGMNRCCPVCKTDIC